MPEYKAWAELVSVPAQYVYALPEGMTALDAVAVTTNYVVAYLLLFEMANLTPGKSLLVHSAGGGVVSTYYIPKINTISNQTIGYHPFTRGKRRSR